MFDCHFSRMILAHLGSKVVLLEPGWSERNKGPYSNQVCLFEFSSRCYPGGSTGQFDMASPQDYRCFSCSARQLRPAHLEQAPGRHAGDTPKQPAYSATLNVIGDQDYRLRLVEGGAERMVT